MDDVISLQRNLLNLYIVVAMATAFLIWVEGPIILLLIFYFTFYIPDNLGNRQLRVAVVN